MVILSALLASQLIFVAANDHHNNHHTDHHQDNIPSFDTGPSCRANIGEGFETLQGCQRDEGNARSTLSKEWKQFPKEDKALCTDMTEGYDPSYVELLSCLEMTRDAKEPPKDLQNPAPTEFETPTDIGK